jgi:two-component system chemotaxis response regulator CheY
MRVLIVDDSRTARLILKSVLPAALKTNLIEASGGQQAVEICRRETIDLMFLDLTMPELDGYGVLAALPDLVQRIAIVVISADIQPGSLEKVLSLGARAFIKKTPTTGALLETLSTTGIWRDGV